MSGFNQPIDIAWREYRAILKLELNSPEEFALAQEAFKQGWAACERADLARKILG